MEHNRVMAFIRRNNPTYKYNIADFRFMGGNLEWDENRLGPRPQPQELESIPEEEVIETSKYVRAKHAIAVVPELKYVLNPYNGILVYSTQTGRLCVYIDGEWKKFRPVVG